MKICPRCNGYKKISSIGGIVAECPCCFGIGHVDDRYIEPEEITGFKANDDTETLAEALADSSNKVAIVTKEVCKALVLKKLGRDVKHR